MVAQSDSNPASTAGDKVLAEQSACHHHAVCHKNCVKPFVALYICCVSPSLFLPIKGVMGGNVHEPANGGEAINVVREIALAPVLG